MRLRRWGSRGQRAGLAKLEPFGLLIVPAAIGFVLVVIFFLLRGYWIAPVALTLTVLTGILGLRPGLETERRVTLILLSSSFGITFVCGDVCP